MNLFKFLIASLILIIWMYFTLYTPNGVFKMWRKLVEVFPRPRKILHLFLDLILLILKGLDKLLDILNKISKYIFYLIPIALSFIFILPCLLLGLVLIFKFHEIFLGLISLICTYVLVRINKDMQGGN